jgi:hypothetical protein
MVSPSLVHTSFWVIGQADEFYIVSYILGKPDGLYPLEGCQLILPQGERVGIPQKSQGGIFRP